MTSERITIVGRGHTAYEHDWASDDAPIMAVSSGMFALPEGVVPAHFVTVDPARYFNSPINDHAIAWRNDPHARHWPFWADPSIIKHVSIRNSAPGQYHAFPLQQIFDAVSVMRNPEACRAAVVENFAWIQTHYGHRPNWGDYPNIRAWPLDGVAAPNFTDLDAPIGLQGMRNSVFMALQVAARLGYRDMRLVGIFDGDGYEPHKEVLTQWQEQAADLGITIGHLQLETVT